MNTIMMNRFGSFLTGRDFGQKAMRELQSQLSYPVALDFAGTISLGSSFGDEIIPVIARKQGDQITVLNTNKAVWDCLIRIAEENKIRIHKA